jgi:threonine/homoserine/homoserine lactone efflux protein
VAKAKGAAPLTFFQSAAFQAVNPKIWATGFSAVTLFATDRLPTSIILVAMVFAVIGLASNAVWAGLGTALRHCMPGVRLRVFNITAALLLVISLYAVLFA